MSSASNDSCLAGYVHWDIDYSNRCIGAREAGTDNTREDVKCDLQMVYEETFDMEEREKVLSRQTVFFVFSKIK